MLSLEQYQIIKEELSKDTASEFVRVMLSSYANTIDKTSELLNYIPKIADRQLKFKQEKINQYSWSTDLLISDQYLHPNKYEKNELNTRFCTLFYTCKAHFFMGNAENESVAGKTFFDEFVDMLKNKKGFNYTDEKDWNWIYTTAGGSNWLENVIKQNIDSEFVKPQNKMSI